MPQGHHNLFIFFAVLLLAICCSVRFVLERALAEHRLRRENGEKSFQHVVALSFSPGVTVEGLLLKELPMTPAMLQY